MAEHYSRSVLRVAVAQIAQHLGWTAIQSTPLELLTDIFERYILETAEYTHRYSEQFGRTEPNLDDIGLAFREMGVNLHELNDYVKSIDVLTKSTETPSFPVAKVNQLQFPKARSRELLERPEHIDEHLPPMYPDWNEEILPSTPRNTSGVSNSFMGNEEPSASTCTPPNLVSGPDKRPFSSPPEGAPAPKKARTLPEEAQPSDYEMKSVQMTHSGFLAPTLPGQGKLPDPRTPPPPTPNITTDTNPMSQSLSQLPTNFKMESFSDDEGPVLIDSLVEEDVSGPVTSTPAPAKLQVPSKADKLKKTSKLSTKIKKSTLKVAKSPKGNRSPRPPKSPRSPGRSPIRAKSPKGTKQKAASKDEQQGLEQLLTSTEVVKKPKKKIGKSPGKSATASNLVIQLAPKKEKSKSTVSSTRVMDSSGMSEVPDVNLFQQHPSYDDIIDKVAAGPSARNSPLPQPQLKSLKKDPQPDSDDVGRMEDGMSSPDINRLMNDLETRQKELAEQTDSWKREIERLELLSEEEIEVTADIKEEQPVFQANEDETMQKLERDRRIESTIDDVIAKCIEPIVKDPEPIAVPKTEKSMDPYAFDEPDPISPFSPAIQNTSDFDFIIKKPHSPREKKEKTKEKSKEKKEKRKERKRSALGSTTDIESSDRDVPVHETDKSQTAPISPVKHDGVKEKLIIESPFDFLDQSQYDQPSKSPKKSSSPPKSISTTTEKDDSDNMPQPAIKKIKITGLGGGPSASWTISSAEASHKEHHKREKKKKKNKDKEKDKEKKKEKEKEKDKEKKKEKDKDKDKEKKKEKEKEKKKEKDKDKEKDKEKKKEKDKHKEKDKKKDKKEKKHKKDSFAPSIPKLTFKLGVGGSNPSVSVSEKKEPLKLKIKPFSPSSDISNQQEQTPKEKPRNEPSVLSPFCVSSPSSHGNMSSAGSPLRDDPVASPPPVKSESPYDLSLSPMKRSPSRSPSPVTHSLPISEPSSRQSDSPLSIPPPSFPNPPESPTIPEPRRVSSPPRSDGVPELSPYRFPSRSPSPRMFRLDQSALEQAHKSDVTTWSPAGSPRWSPTPIPTFESPSSLAHSSPPTSYSPKHQSSQSPVSMPKSFFNSPTRNSPTPSPKPPALSPPTSSLPLTPAARTPSLSPPPASPPRDLEVHSDDNPDDQEPNACRTVITETVGTSLDENGETVWICPACKMPDDGSPMIGCDGEICDDWYHWPCVGITSEPPEEEKWYCPKCKSRVRTKAARKKRPTPKRGGKGKKKF